MMIGFNKRIHQKHKPRFTEAKHPADNRQGVFSVNVRSMIFREGINNDQAASVSSFHQYQMVFEIQFLKKQLLTREYLGNQ